MKTSIKAILTAAVLGCLCYAAGATQITYVLTIDWEQSPDQLATFTFDDENDTTARYVSWGGQVPTIQPRPDTVSFASLVGPSIPQYSGQLTFDGESVTSLSLCDNFWSGCSERSSSFGGHTGASFTLHVGPLSAVFGSAERATLRADTANNLECSNRFSHPQSCLQFELGRTSFVELTPPVAPIPEPGTVTLLLAGLLATTVVIRRRRSTAI